MDENSRKDLENTEKFGENVMENGDFGEKSQKNENFVQNTSVTPLGVLETSSETKEPSNPTMAPKLQETLQDTQSAQNVALKPVRKPKKSHKKLIIIMAILAIVVAGTGGVIWCLLTRSSGDDTLPSANEIDESGGGASTSADAVEKLEPGSVTELDINSDLVQRLYNNMIASTMTNIGPIIYSNERMMAGDFTENEMKIWAINALSDAAGERGNDFERFRSETRCQTNVPTGTYQKYFGRMDEYNVYGKPEFGCYTGTAVQTKVKETFGIDINFVEGETLAHNFCGVFLYSAQTDEFYTMAECGGVGQPFPLQVPYRAEKVDDKVYVYVAAAWMVFYELTDGGNLGFEGYRYKILTDNEYLENTKNFSRDCGYADTLIRRYGDLYWTSTQYEEIPAEYWQEWDKYRWEFVWNGENYVYSKVEKI